MTVFRCQVCVQNIFEVIIEETKVQIYVSILILGVAGNQRARRKPTKVAMESANQIHIQPLDSYIGEKKC